MLKLYVKSSIDVICKNMRYERMTCLRVGKRDARRLKYPVYDDWGVKMPKPRKRSLIPRRISAEEAENNVNEYYLRVSGWFMRVKYAVLVLLFVYLTVMLTAYRSYITYDNLAYLLRDFGSSGDINSGFSDVTYDEQNNMSVCVYKGALAVAGNSSVTLYDSSAAKMFTYPSGMDSPVIVPSEKYLLAYDLGGTTYSLYTNLTRVFSREADSVIENADISDSGEFVLVRRARDSRYVISYYNSSFECEADYYKSKCVTDVSLSDDGKKILIVTIDTAGASFQMQTELYSKGSDTPLSSYSGDGMVPLDSEFFSDGSFAVICDKAVLFFDENGTLRSTYQLSAAGISAFDFNGDTFAVSLSENVMGDKNTIIIFDNGGNIRYNIKIDRKVDDISHNEEYVYVLTPGKTLRYSGADTVDECDAPIDSRFINEMGNFALLSTQTESRAVFGREK